MIEQRSKGTARGSVWQSPAEQLKEAQAWKPDQCVCVGVGGQVAPGRGTLTNKSDLTQVRKQRPECMESHHCSVSHPAWKGLTLLTWPGCSEEERRVEQTMRWRGENFLLVVYVVEMRAGEEAGLAVRTEKGDLLWTHAGRRGSNLIWAPQRFTNPHTVCTFLLACGSLCVHVCSSGLSQLVWTFIYIKFLSLEQMGCSVSKWNPFSTIMPSALETNER